jgi:hypothetical protein
MIWRKTFYERRKGAAMVTAPRQPSTVATTLAAPGTNGSPLGTHRGSLTWRIPWRVGPLVEHGHAGNGHEARPS